LANEEAKKICTELKTTSIILPALANNPVVEKLMYHNCASMCSVGKREEGANTIYISIVFMNYRNSNQNAADYFLCLIAKLTSVSGESDVRTQGVDESDWNEVGINVCYDS
jgi:hypothetical protein